MSFDKAVNLRASAAYVTDGANETYFLGNGDTGGGAYPITRGGVTFGWVVTYGDNARDRNASVDRRLAGLNFVANSGTRSDFRVDAPASGATTVHIGGSDYYYGGNEYIEIRDGAGLLASVASGVALIGANTSGAGQSIDAAGSMYTDAAWPTSEAGAAVTLSTTYVIIRCGSSTAQTGNTVLSHVRLVQAATGINASFDGTISVAGSASGSVASTGSASGIIALTGSASVSVALSASLAETIAVSGSSTGTVASSASLSGTIALTGSGTAQELVQGTLAGTIVFSGSGTASNGTE